MSGLMYSKARAISVPHFFLLQISAAKLRRFRLKREQQTTLNDTSLSPHIMRRQKQMKNKTDDDNVDDSAVKSRALCEL